MTDTPPATATRPCRPPAPLVDDPRTVDTDTHVIHTRDRDAFGETPSADGSATEPPEDPPGDAP